MTSPAFCKDWFAEMHSGPSENQLTALAFLTATGAKALHWVPETAHSVGNNGTNGGDVNGVGDPRLNFACLVRAGTDRPHFSHLDQ